MQETMDAPKLRRELSIWEAIGISLALMAPSMAANINPQGPATLVGRAVPLTFIMATIGVLLVAYTFVRLTQRFNHSGSVYGHSLTLLAFGRARRIQLHTSSASSASLVCGRWQSRQHVMARVCS